LVFDTLPPLLRLIMPPLSLMSADDYDAYAIIFAIIFARRFRCHADFRHAFDTPRPLIDFRPPALLISPR
jgi:hypothetical protein